MKVQATQIVEAHLSEKEVWRVVDAYLRESYSWAREYYLLEGKVFKKVTFTSPSRAWVEEEFVRDATADDVIAASLFRKLGMEYVAMNCNIS
jgi:hypothetical protein